MFWAYLDSIERNKHGSYKKAVNHIQHVLSSYFDKVNSMFLVSISVQNMHSTKITRAQI